MNTEHHIVFNAGSSSIKFSIFDATHSQLEFGGSVDNILENPALRIFDANKKQIFSNENIQPNHHAALSSILAWHESHNEIPITAAGHRVVHGGKKYRTETIISPEILKDLETLIPLAPLHQPHNLYIIQTLMSLHPKLTQVACFDTAFHRTQSWQAEAFALPEKYAEMGILRYGFHGLSYEYIASILPQIESSLGNKRIIAAHLGNGASMCALQAGKSIASTMGFTALDGLMMGSRCGAIDPGVILYLLEEKNYSLEAVTQLLYRESGLKGVSGISHDVRTLLANTSPHATKAIELFCYQAAKQLSSLIPTLNGLDGIVFTAGIGENSPEIRKSICDKLSYLGISLNEEANQKSETAIHSSDSSIQIYVIPTNEALMIAQKTKKICEMHS